MDRDAVDVRKETGKHPVGSRVRVSWKHLPHQAPRPMIVCGQSLLEWDEPQLLGVWGLHDCWSSMRENTGVIIVPDFDVKELKVGQRVVLISAFLHANAHLNRLGIIGLITAMDHDKAIIEVLQVPAEGLVKSGETETPAKIGDRVSERLSNLSLWAPTPEEDKKEAEEEEERFYQQMEEYRRQEVEEQEQLKKKETESAPPAPPAVVAKPKACGCFPVCFCNPRTFEGAQW
jgi:carbonic anhydrase/acetyltransferase-like protein (isoleucine patch superfamily)